MQFIVDKVKPPSEYYTSQRNNKYYPFLTCYPTSMASSIYYILKSEGKTKQDIGIGLTDPNEQIEDHITMDTLKPTMIDYMIRVGGSWTRSYTNKPWIVAVVEEKEFDDMMKKLGYDAKFNSSATFDYICSFLKKTNIPQVIFGEFGPVMKKSTVRDHVNCVIGFDDNTGEVICNDPYGNALTDYTDYNGCAVKYPWEKIFCLDKKKKTGWLMEITKK